MTNLHDAPRYIYGTTRLGDEGIPFADRVAIARAAIDAGAWLHTSDQYGSALQVLNAAFDTDRANVPPTIFKVGWESVAQIRGQIESQLAAVGLEHMAVAQLCLGGQLAEAFRTNGPELDGLRALQTEGLVGRYVLETWPWTSDVALDGLRSGAAAGLIDAYIFYFNPLQRFVTNELWDAIGEAGFPIVSMRTVCGGSPYRLHAEYLEPRGAAVAPIFERSGCETWTEFCVRFIYGSPGVLTTVGSTARAENLAEFLAATEAIEPLAADVQADVEALQRKWSDDHDRHAAPWTM